MRKALQRLAAVIVLTFSVGLVMAQTFTYPVKGPNGFSLTSKTSDRIDVNYNVQQFSFSDVAYQGEVMQEIDLTSGVVLPNDAGLPNLPTESRMLAIPTGAKPVLKVLSYERETLHNVNIAPALRIQMENEEPDMNYVKDMKVYAKNAFYPAEPFMVAQTYIRGVDAATVSVTPFQYNPVTKDLVVYSNVRLAIEFEGGNGHFGEDRLRSPYWDPILAAELMNYDQLPVIDYEARMQQWLRDDEEGAEYLIITPNHDAWAEYANQLKDYRTRQGIITKVYRLDEMPATTTDMMKSWFHNAYNTWEIAPVAVCLLGDHGTNMGQYIPAETVSHPYEGSCITDNRYADVSGDNLPDMVFSRLVAQSPTELPVFISKQIEYEYTNPNMDPNFYTRPITALGWQTERWFQICSEVFGGYMRQKGYDPNRINCIYSGTPGSSWSSNQNTNMVVSYFGPNGRGYIPASPEDLGGWNGGTPQQVVDAVNAGSFWLQHRDHGEEHGWGEPAVKNSHVAQMNNVGKMPFVMSINCLTGKFNYNTDCFAEAWMRRTYNGENAGAVGILCPTEVSYSFVNDTYVWGVYDLFDGDFMPDYGPYQPAAPQTGNWMPAFGNVAGKYFLAQSNWPSNPESKDITYTMFTAHCDAFLRIYTQVPEEMSVTHPEVIIAGQGEMQVSAPEGCVISLVKEGDEGGWDILAVAQATGVNQVIEFEPQVPPTEIHLVVTGQNYLRYEAVMGVIPDEGPYIVFDSDVIHDEDGNGQLDFGETINLDITLKNVGSDPMDAFEAVLATTSEYITIVNGTAQFASIAPNSIQSLNDAFTFVVADNVPDRTNNVFTITVTNGDKTFVSKMNLKSYAPELKLGNLIITELDGNGNGRLDAGETATLSFPLENKGHSTSLPADVELMMLSPYINVEESTLTLNGLEAGRADMAIFNVSVADNTPVGYTCSFSVNVTSGQYGDNKDYAVKVGLIIEDFESGTLGEGWTNDADHPWTVVTEDPYEGVYCVRSGAIGNNGTTTLILTHEAGSIDTISFYYKVSSENSYDKLHFYVDNVEKGNWSGSISWTKTSYPVLAGVHQYKWTYTKDVSMASGEDCAWIDYISLPAERIMAGTAGNDLAVCQGNDAQIVGYAINYQTVSWATSGDGTFANGNTPTPIYTPGVQDIENKEVTLTITITGNGQTITDDMVLSIFTPVEIENALPEAHYCNASVPQEVGVTLSGEYSSFHWATSGDGIFEDETATMTTYTPGEQDLLNGVTISAIATAEGCGNIAYEVPFEMNPMPTVEIAIPDCEFSVCQGSDLILEYTAAGFIDGAMTIEVNGVATTLMEGEDLVIASAGQEPGIYSVAFGQASNEFCSSEIGQTIEYRVIAKPELTAETIVVNICEGETARFDLNLQGGEGIFVLLAEGMDEINIEGDTYALELTPESSMEIRLTQLVAVNTGCGDNCVTDLDLTLQVIIEEYVEKPELSGDAEPDSYVTPSTTYTVTNNVPVSFSITPEEAGSLTPANDGVSVMVTWAANFVGNAVIEANPISVCNNGANTLDIVVKNSSDVDENANAPQLYPNPVADKLHIDMAGMTHVTVYSILGQQVYDSEVNADATDIDVSAFQAGTYIVRISTGSNFGFTKRFTVVK